MKITVLAENSICQNNSKAVKPEHGLSLYIEYRDKKILFDVGQSDLFIKNAVKLGVDLSLIDYVFISHGHIDHGGGIEHFLKINKTAKIYLHRRATEKYYTKIFGWIPYYVGLNRNIIKANSDRFIFIEKDLFIADGINLIEEFLQDFPQPEANRQLFEKSGSQFTLDKFKHELVLLLEEKDGAVLFTACSHSGIINMVNTALFRFPQLKFKAIFGGFHTHNPINRRDESDVYIEKLITALGNIKAVFYTGHCTGQKNFKKIKEKLGEKIQTMNTGEIIEV